jgi:2-polyprenyl-3-methyl-5-hydroxy-6-metoxy-1,4-benzoquinol methylase
VAPRANAFWLDVGCGTGLFTELILDTRSPARVIGIDQAAAQIDYASRKPVAQRASFRIAAAELPRLSEADDRWDAINALQRSYAAARG